MRTYTIHKFFCQFGFTGKKLLLLQQFALRRKYWGDNCNVVQTTTRPQRICFKQTLCKQRKNTVMVVLETHLVIAKIKNLPRFLANSSRVRIFCAAHVVADFSNRATRADDKIYGVSTFCCTGTLTRTRFRIKRYTVLKSENLSFQWYQIEYGAFKLSWCKFMVKMNVFFDSIFAAVENEEF